MSTTTTDELLVPVARLRPIVERWLAGFETIEDACQQLAADSPYKADTWRKRLSETTYTGKRGTELALGWLAMIEIDFADADEFLTAAGLAHLWYGELRDLLPEPPQTAEDFDAHCAICSKWIDWDNRPWAGVRMELKEPGRWTRWWSVCALCLARRYPTPRKADATGTVARRRIADRVLLGLYERYVEDEIGLDRLAAEVYERFGFPTAGSCSASIRRAWHQAGWPMRDRNASKRLNGKHRHRKPGTAIPEADLRRMHLLHSKRGHSVNAMCRQLHVRYGYASSRSMVSAVSRGWKLLGLKARDRIEMTVAASTIHGRARRHRTKGVNGSKSLGYRRWLLDQRAGHSTLQPDCVEVKTNGRRCKGRSLVDSDYCEVHDPRRREKREADLVRMRANSPSQARPLVEWEPIRLLLHETHERLGSWRAVADLLGLSVATVKTYAGKTDRRITDVKAAAFRAALEPTAARQAASPPPAGRVLAEAA